MTRYAQDGSPLITPVASGGTGVATIGAYGLIAGGTTNTGNIQSAGTGLLDQWYRSLDSASLGIWTSQNQLGGKILLASNSVSAVASIDLTSLFTTSYQKYELLLSGIVPATTNSSLRILTSSNNGSSWDSAAASYMWRYAAYGDTGANNSNAGTASTSSTFIQMTEGISSTVNANDFQIDIINPAFTANQNGFTWHGRYLNNTPVFRWNQGVAIRLASVALNAFQVKFSAGNIAQCTYKLYGLY